MEQKSQNNEKNPMNILKNIIRKQEEEIIILKKQQEGREYKQLEEIISLRKQNLNLQMEKVSNIEKIILLEQKIEKIINGEEYD